MAVPATAMLLIYGEAQYLARRGSEDQNQPERSLQETSNNVPHHCTESSSVAGSCGDIQDTTMLGHMLTCEPCFD